MTKFNSIGFTIFGIPPYFFCAVVGIVVAVSMHIVFIFSKGYHLQKHMRVLVASVFSLLFFTKLFGCLSGIYRALGVGEKITFDTIKNTGIVFYGGLFGLLIAYYALCKTHYIDEVESDAINILAVSIPVFHAIARVGCFLAGCCYGIEYDGFGAIQYTFIDNNVEMQLNILPVQLIEAVFNVIIFLFLFWNLKQSDWKNRNILVKYLTIYSCGRFLLEIFRGDTVRGVIGGISFSQFISVLIWLGLAVWYFKKKSRIKKENIL